MRIVLITFGIIIAYSANAAENFVGVLNCRADMGGSFTLTREFVENDWLLTAASGTLSYFQDEEISLIDLSNGQYQVAFKNSDGSLTRFYPCEKL